MSAALRAMVTGKDAGLIEQGGARSSADSVVEVWRGPMIESQHRLSVAVVDAGNRLRAHTGAADRVVYARSAVKPIQALPLVTDGVMERFGLTDAELALACASHSGEARHVAGVRSMLRKAGVSEASLACGAHAPFHAPSALDLRRQGVQPGRIHNNCSGKHAGMLALALAHDWPADGYHEPGHPVQVRMLEEMSRWCGVPADDVALATDGCGVVTFGVSLRQLAWAFAQLSWAARQGEAAPRRVVSAMVEHADLIGGTDRLCTRVMQVTEGRVFLKVGAEGIYCAGAPGAELGVALKVEDGAARAADAAIVAVLRLLALVSEDEMGELDRFAEPAVRNTRGDVVGAIRARVELQTENG
jgi:L-asparaginase II